MHISRVNHQKNKTAFTLIELLVVIAIIAILAAMLFPVFGRAREKARQATCLSNLKQFGLAITQYTQDHDEKFPPCIMQENGLWKYSIVNMLDPYTKSRQLWKCPSQSTDPVVADPNTDNALFSFNYTVNYQVMGFLYPGVTANMPISLSKLDEPTTTLMMFCWPGSVPSDTMYLGSASDINLKRNNAIAAGKPDPLKIHNEGSLILFADAHAKWQQPTMANGILSERTWTPAAD